MNYHQVNINTDTIIRWRDAIAPPSPLRGTLSDNVLFIYDGKVCLGHYDHDTSAWIKGAFAEDTTPISTLYGNGNEVTKVTAWAALLSVPSLWK